MMRRLVRALAGDINAVLPVAAPVTVKVWSEHAEAAILGRLRFTVAWRIVVPLPPPDGVCQVARPVASDVSTLPTHGVPHVIITCHSTRSFALFVVVPILIFPFENIRIRSLGAVFVVTSRVANTRSH